MNVGGGVDCDGTLVPVSTACVRGLRAEETASQLSTAKDRRSPKPIGLVPAETMPLT